MRRWQAEAMFQPYPSSKAGIRSKCNTAGPENTWNAGAEKISSTTTGLYTSSEDLGDTGIFNALNRSSTSCTATYLATRSYASTGNYYSTTVDHDVYGPGDQTPIARNLRSSLGTLTRNWFYEYLSVYEANMGMRGTSLDDYLNKTNFYHVGVNDS
jgi:hypothetical protein